MPEPYGPILCPGPRANLSHPVRKLNPMRTNDETSQASTASIDPFDDPVAFLRALGLEATLIAEIPSGLGQAA